MDHLLLPKSRAGDPADGPRRGALDWKRITVFDVADVASSLTFLVGSVLFYPRFWNLGGIESLGGVVGAYLFVLGSVLMLLLMVRDLRIMVSTMRQLEKERDALPERRRRRSTIVQLVEDTTVTVGDLIILLLNVAAALLFVAGSAYFHPRLHALDPTLGCTLFVAGCVLQIAATLWDTGRLLTRNARSTTRDEVATLFLPFVGSLLFLLGCLFFYPRYQREEFDGVYATTYFVVGSAAYLTSSLCNVVVISVRAPAESADRRSMAVLRRKTVLVARVERSGA